MVNRIFSTIYNNVGSNVQDTSSSLQTTIKRYINDVYVDFLRRINWRSINTSYSFATVSGTKDYVLPNDFGKELYVYDSTYLRDIPFISLEQMENDRPARLATQGTVDAYSIFDSPVRVQPSSSSALSIVSSSSADTTQTIGVKGIDSNGIEFNETLTLTGTTPVVSSNSYTELRSLTKSASTTGKITITSNSAAVTNAIMSPADIDYRVKIMRFQDIPGSGSTMSVPYHRSPYPLINDNDVPVVDCADILELGATAKIWRYKRQFAKAADYDGQYERQIINKIWNDENQPNQTHLIHPRTYSRDLF